MHTTITTTLEKKKVEHLRRLALRYGLSLEDFASRVLSEISGEIPEETLSEYKSPKSLSASLKQGVKDWKRGRVSTQL